ncbi:MAG: DctP family TRAP transporter solute-binding subunit [Ostreibacterium sp.]
MKKKLIPLLVLSILVIGANSTFAAKKKMMIKFSHVVGENTPKGKMANRFKELIDKKLGNQVEVEVFPNSQLFNDNKVLEAMLLGDVQMAAPSLAKFDQYTEKLQVFTLPFLFDDFAAVKRFQDSKIGQRLLHSVEDKGILGLGYLLNGFQQISANTPLRKPSDAKGKKFRIQNSDVLEAQYNALGAVPLKKPFSEVFTLLQTKAIDGQENTWPNIYSKKFYEVQPYISETSHGLNAYMVVTSTAFWNSIEPNLRAKIKEILDESIDYGNQQAIELAKIDKQKVIDSGQSTVITLTQAEREQWKKVLKPVWKQFENKIGADLVKAAEAANHPAN